MTADYDKQFFERAYSGTATEILKNIRDLPVILGFLDPKPDEKILDVGCGLGSIADVIAKHGAEVTGLEISVYATEKAKLRYESRKELQFICMNALEMDYEGQFDKVLCYHLIEHLDVDEGRVLLRKIRNALKSDGILVLGLPINDFTLFRRLLRLIALRPWRGEPTHITSFSIEEIQREIASAGFNITDICPLSYSGIRIPKRLSRIPLIKQLVFCTDILAVKREESRI